MATNKKGSSKVVDAGVNKPAQIVEAVKSTYKMDVESNEHRSDRPHCSVRTPLFFRAFAVLTLMSTSDTVSAQIGDVERVHDPCVIESDGRFYLFSTGMAYHLPTGPSIQVRSSPDLLRWKRTESVFNQLPRWTSLEVPGVRDLWAPDISFFNGRYHLYYSVSTFGSGRACIGLATTPTLNDSSDKYQWVDHGKIMESVPGKDDWCAIDPNVVIDRRGQPWLSFGSFRSGIKLVQLNPKTGKPNAELLSIAERHDGTKAIEAPFIVRKNRYFYLFVSFDFCCKGMESDYNIMVGRSTQVTGPYKDRAGTSMIEGGGTLVLKGYKNVIGPGHCAVLLNDNQDWLVHHYYNADRNGTPTLQVRPIIWSDDEWPLAGEPISSTLTEGTKPKQDIVGLWEHFVDFRKTGEIDLRADGSIGGGAAKWRYGKSDLLTLHWPDPDAPNGTWVDRCWLGRDRRCYVGWNQDGVMIRGVRVE